MAKLTDERKSVVDVVIVKTLATSHVTTTTVEKPVLPKTSSKENPLFALFVFLAAGGSLAFVGRKEEQSFS